MTFTLDGARAERVRPGALFVGLATVDVLYGVNAVPRSNQKVVAAWQEVCAGGPATNAAITCAHLGGRATLAAAVGTHPLGAIVRDDLARRGVELVDLAPGLDVVPPVSSVLIDRRAGDRAVVSANAGAWPTRLLSMPAALFEHVAVVLVDGHCLSAAIEATHLAREHGLITVMDGGSWKPGLEELLVSIDIAICAADFQPPGCDGHEAVSTRLRRFGVRAVAITRGADAVLCWEGERATSVPVPSVQVVDTLGAGDVLHGAFCYYLATAPGGFLAAVEAAVAVASRSCTHRGARAWMDAGRSQAGTGRAPHVPPKTS